MGYDFVARVIALFASAQVASVVASAAAGVRISSQTLRLFGSMPITLMRLPGAALIRFSAAAFSTGRSAASSISPSVMRITCTASPDFVLSQIAVRAAPGRVMVRTAALFGEISPPRATTSCLDVSAEPAATTSTAVLS